MIAGAGSGIGFIPTKGAKVPFYRIANSDPVLSINQGGSDTVTFTFSLKAGLREAVTLAASTPPAGVTLTFDDNTIFTGPAGNVSVLTVDVGSSVVPGTYTIIVTATAVSQVRHTAFTLTVNSVPVITVQPQDGEINSGDTAFFTVTATGTGLHYQWYQGTSGTTTTPVGIDSSSFTSPTLTVETSYWVRVSNAFAHDDSNTATISIATVGDWLFEPDDTWHDSGVWDDSKTWPELPLSNDTSLSLFTVEGDDHEDGDTIEMPFGTATCDVVATPTDGAATLTINGLASPQTISLSTGDNVITVTVTAEDLSTEDYVVTVHVLTAGLPEITEVTLVPDIAGSEHDTSFQIRKSGNVPVAIVLDGGAKTETVTVDFTGLTAADFVNLGPGKGFTLDSLGTAYTVWYRTATETEPAGASNPTVIDIGVFDNDVAIAAATATQWGGGGGFISVSVSVAVVTFSWSLAGIRTFSDPQDSGTTILVTQPGRNAAAAVGGMTNLTVPITDNDSADIIGEVIVTQTDGQGWAVVNVLGVVTFTDSTVGIRTNASDTGGTGFTINVTQQGTNPV